MARTQKSCVAVLPALVILSTASITCGLPTAEGNNETGPLGEMLLKPLYGFTGQLYKTLAGDENLILSPVSIHQALNMLLLGADPNSQTRDELLEAIGYEVNNDEQLNECHKDYSQMLATFRAINEQTQRAQKDYRARVEAEGERVFHGNPPESPTMQLFNMLLLKNSSKANETFAANIDKFFEASVQTISDEQPASKTQLLDFLNGWAKDAGFESPIMKSAELDEKFAAMLVSAINVQAFWFEEFSEHKKKDVFFNRGLKSEPVEGVGLFKSKIPHARYLALTVADKPQHKTLFTSEESSRLYQELSGLDCQVVEVPLRGDVKLTIFEPLSYSSETSSQLAILTERLLDGAALQNRPTKLSKVLQLLDSDDGQLFVDELTMPKFKFESEIDLKAALQSMGLRRIFSDTGAQLSRVVDDKLYIDKIKHLAVVEASKSGIKAAGVTVVKMMNLMAVLSIRQPLRVEITKPFLFLIRYKSIPLFVGQLTRL